MAVTIRDVAKRAGVTIGTVSRALNDYKDISPSTKERIFEAIEELGYTPNVIARGLSSKTASNIGVMISGLLDSNRYDNFSFLLMQGIYRFASESDLEISVYAIDSHKQRQKSYAQFCRERNISGAILSGITTTDAYFRELMDTEIPCVTIDVPIIGSNVGWVSIDNIKASKEIIQYLVVRNHRDFVIIAGKKNAAVTLERIAGYEEGMREHGIRLSNETILYCDFDEENAFLKVSKYLQQHGKKAATAFVCMSDILALGTIRAIKNCGYQVPEDFSVTGFDDIPLAEFIQPALTTVRQDIARNGYEGAKLLKRFIDHKATEKHLYLPHDIIVRNSVREL